jgi:hypothetical protein
MPKATIMREGAVMLGEAGTPMLTYLSFHEATGKTPSLANLARRVRKLSLEGWIVVVSQLLYRLADDHEATQTAIANSLPRDVRRRIDRYVGRRVLVSTERLHATLRAAFLYAPQGSVPESLDSVSEHEADVFDVSGALTPTAASMAKFANQTFLRAAGRERGVPMLEIGRAHRLFRELAGERAALTEVARARLHESFESYSGMSLERELAIRGAICTRFMTVDTTRESLSIRPDYFQSTAIEADEAARVLRSLSTDIATATSQVQALHKAGADAFYDPRPFSSSPLIEIESDCFVPVDPAMLLVRLVGDGIWWRLRMAFRGRGDIFNAAVGRLFETYVTELAQATIRLPDTTVIPEFEYAKGALGPDLCIVSATAVVVLEVSAERPLVAETILAASPESFHCDLEAIIVKRVTQQLAPKARMIVSGAIPVDDASGKPVIPVLVLIDGIPRGPGLNDEIRSVARQAGLGSGAIQDLIVLSATEWEALCGLAEHHGVQPAEFLRAWKDEAADADLLEVIHAHYDEIPIPQYTRDAFERASTGWIEQAQAPACEASRAPLSS